MNENRVRIEELLYYVFLLLMMGAKGIGLTGGQKVFTLCSITAYCFIGIKMLITEYSVKEWCINAGLLLMAILIKCSSGESAAIAAVLMIIGMKNISLLKAMKAAFFIWGGTFVFSIIRGLAGLGDGVIVVHQKLGLGPIIRYSLGYTHPNVLHVTYFILVMLFLYVFQFKSKKLWLMVSILFGGNIYIFLYSISYTGFIIVTVYLCFMLYLDARIKLSYAEKRIIECFAPLCILFPIAGPFVIKGNLFNILNKLLSTRFHLVYYFFTNFKPSLFGTKTITPTDAHLTLDSSFAYLLMYYGIIAFIVMVILYLMTIHKYLRENQYKETAIMVCTALAGVTEQFLFNLSFKNITFMCIGDYLFNYLLTKEKGGIWNKRFSFIHLNKFSISIPVRKVQQGVVWECIKQVRWKGCILTGVIVAISFLLIFLSFWKIPEQVYVNRGLTEYEGEYFVADESGEWKKDNSIYIGNMQPGEKIYEFQGNIIKMECIRGGVSSFVWGGLIGSFISVLFEGRRYWGLKKKGCE